MNIKMKGFVFKVRKINLYPGKNQTKLTTILKLVPAKDVCPPYALQSKHL